jgi:hypothetical protein
MRVLSFTIALCLAFMQAGCTHRQLAHNTITQANTHTDIIYRQVLNNLAAAECNPDVLPHFSVVGTGGTLVIDSANTNLGLTWDAFGFTGASLGLGADRAFEDGWTLAPVTNPDKLRAIRSFYQLTTRGQTTDSEGYELLQAYLGPTPERHVRHGWYGSGRKKNVPKNACYVACCGDRYVWVTADGLEGLSQMSLAVLNIATVDASAAAVAADEDVTIEDEEGVRQMLPTPRGDAYEVQPRPRENYYNPFQSQIQMAR